MSTSDNNNFWYWAVIILFIYIIAKAIIDYIIAHWPWFALAGIIIAFILIRIIILNHLEDRQIRQKAQTRQAPPEPEPSAKTTHQPSHEELIRKQKAEMERLARENAAMREKMANMRTDGGVMDRKTALSLFELAEPYSQTDLKKRRMEIMKKVHPDQGGSNLMARMVNDAYELLKQE